MGLLLSETLEVSESLEHLVLLGFFFQRPLVEYFALVTFILFPILIDPNFSPIIIHFIHVPTSVFCDTHRKMGSFV